MWPHICFQCEFPAACISTLLSASLMFSRFWIVCQKTSIWACFLVTLKGFSSWQKLNWTFALFPADGEMLSTSALPTHSLLHVLCFFSSPLLCHPSPSFPSFSLSSLFPSTGYSFHHALLKPLTPDLPLPPTSSILSSSPNYLSTFILLLLPSLPLPPSHPCLVPSETQPSWHIVFTQPFTGCLGLLPIRCWGRTDRENQPFGGFFSRPTCLRACRWILKHCEKWLFQSRFSVLSSFSIYSVSSDSCL